MTDRIQEFFRARRAAGRGTGPCLVVDLEVVRDNYSAFAQALPDTRVFYAVKANPAPEVLDAARQAGLLLRHRLGRRDPSMVLAAGATPDRISFGNTIKKERDIARAYELGIRLFAVDCIVEVEKMARAARAPRCSAASCCDGAGAEWPLSRKFGCEPAMAVDVLEHAHRLGLERLWRLVPCRLAAAQPSMPGTVRLRPAAGRVP